jgi:hypothetical protein
MESFNHLAQNEDWLADQYDEIIHSQDAPQYEVVGKGFDRKAIADSEEHILRCKLQRELFDTAGSLGDLPCRRQIVQREVVFSTKRPAWNSSTRTDTN